MNSTSDGEEDQAVFNFFRSDYIKTGFMFFLVFADLNTPFSVFFSSVADEGCCWSKHDDAWKSLNEICGTIRDLTIHF